MSASKSVIEQLSPKADSSLERLKELLRTQLQLDSPELDFGIYRIMNYRRKEIEEFIEKGLLGTVEK